MYSWVLFRNKKLSQTIIYLEILSWKDAAWYVDQQANQI